MKKLPLFITLIFLASCTAMQIDSSIDKYDSVADQAELGMSKQEALAILTPTQESLSKSYKKRPEKYIKDNVKVEIYYMRSARQADGITTDDEFTPYLFNDGKLVGIGWQVLGGPKTQGQATSDTYINNTNTNSNTTIIY